jgi:cellulose synthase/poly-beta-1,6-N-acetylglucosamine synthase-like glycosyltransferase
VTFLAVLFWACVLAVAWSYVGYGRWLRHVAARRPSMPVPVPARDADLPLVGVIVAAFNEEVHVGARVRNLLGIDYPADRLRVYVGSDGSRDRTIAEATAAAAGDPRVRVVDFPVNRGKASVLNDLVALAREPILVFTDANTEFEPAALRRLAEHFRDPSVGAVSGTLRLRDPGGGSNQDHVYWEHEQQMKQVEDRVGALLGANGGIYAIRRERVSVLAADTVCDDFIMVMRAATAGARVRFEPAAVAWEDVPHDMAEEYKRRVRIGIGNYQALFRHPEFLLQGGAMRRFAYLSHKVLRWIAPHLLLVAGLAAAVLAAGGSSFYAALLSAGLAGATCCAIAYATRERVRWPAPVGAATFVALLNLAFLVGSLRYATGNYRGAWARSARGGSMPGTGDAGSGST